MLKEATDNYVEKLNNKIKAIKNHSLSTKELVKTHKEFLIAKEEMRAIERDLINE